MDDKDRFLTLSKLYTYPIEEKEFFFTITHRDELLKHIFLYLTCVLNYKYDRIDIDENIFIHLNKGDTHIVFVFYYGYFQNIILNEHKIMIDQFLYKINSGEIF